MDPAQIQIPRRVDPVPSAASVDGKRLRCSTMLANPISKDNDNTSSSLAPLDDDNLLQEILLRLPPLPSALPRASLVSTRWLYILSDPQFLCRFRKHHRKPPLLGFFTGTTGTEHNFVPLPVMKTDRIPEERFSVPKSSRSFGHWEFLGCRHGLAVMVNYYGEVIIWDPLTGLQHRVPSPPGLHNVKRETFWVWHAAVLCADAENGHVHGDCLSRSFKLVLICGGRTQAFACLYKSSGVWGNIVSATTTNAILKIRPSILIGNALFWLLWGGDVLAFDIERQSLGVIEKPAHAHGTNCYSFQLLRTDDSCLGFAVLSDLSIQLWKRKSNSDGLVHWIPLQKTIQLGVLFRRGVLIDHKTADMVGYDEDSNVILLATYIGDFMLQLDSMQFSRLSKKRSWSHKIYYPYRNFYTVGNASIRQGSWMEMSGSETVNT